MTDKPILVCVVTEDVATCRQHTKHPVDVALNSARKLYELGVCGNVAHLKEARLVRVTVEYLP